MTRKARAGRDIDDLVGTDLPREWLVIESAYKRAVFRDREDIKPCYIPRDVAEELLGRDLGGNVWFSREESEKMQAHPEWRVTEP
jgi:hypothetical protein